MAKPLKSEFVKLSLGQTVLIFMVGECSSQGRDREIGLEYFFGMKLHCILSIVLLSKSRFFLIFSSYLFKSCLTVKLLGGIGPSFSKSGLSGCFLAIVSLEIHFLCLNRVFLKIVCIQPSQASLTSFFAPL